MSPAADQRDREPRPLRLALIQMTVRGGAMEENLARAEALIARAADAGAQVALLPETLDLGWTHPSARSRAEPIPEGVPFTRLASAARRHRLYLAAGLTERADSRVFNAAVLIGPDGRLLLHHRKLNELQIAHDLYAQGRGLAVASTPLATFGLMICSDAFAPGHVLARSLGLMGADVILSPCAWAVPPGRDLAREPYGAEWRACYAPVARDFRLWIAAASSVGPLPAGPWAGWRCIGASLLFDPDGREALQGPAGLDAEDVLLADIDPRPRPARGDGWAGLWNSAPLQAAPADSIRPPLHPAAFPSQNPSPGDRSAVRPERPG